MGTSSKKSKQSAKNSTWKNEQEMCDFLMDLSNGALEKLIGKQILMMESEVVLPIGATRRHRGTARVDILVVDEDKEWHLVEVKHPKPNSKGLLDNAQGIAQLLFYDAIISEKHGVQVASMNLVTSSFDVVSSEIVPRNKLNIRIAKITKTNLEIITSFEKKTKTPQV